jgi:hypothetical protein
MAKRTRQLKRESTSMAQTLRRAMKVLGADGVRKMIDMVKADKPPCQIKRALMPYIRRYVSKRVGQML